MQADKAVVTASDVDAYMHEKWDRVLTYLVEPRSSAKVSLHALFFLHLLAFSSVCFFLFPFIFHLFIAHSVFLY